MLLLLTVKKALSESAWNNKQTNKQEKEVDELRREIQEMKLLMMQEAAKNSIRTVSMRFHVGTVVALERWGDLLLSGSMDGTIKVIRLTATSQQIVREGRVGPVFQLRVANNLLFSGNEGVIRVYNHEFTQVGELPGHRGSVKAMSIFGNFLIAGSTNEIKVWQFADTRPEDAQALGFAFVDTDQYIEAALGRSIPDIFATEGEAFFRDRELDAAEALARGKGQVIACGGGLPTRAESIGSLKDSGTVVFLRRDPGEIYDNVSMGGRPLGQQGREAFLERYAGREPIYLEWADHIVEVQATPAETVQRILEVLK